jgi:hypothetical protein
MHSLPTVPLGPHSITRLIVGGNPFCGNSHYSRAADQEMRDYYTAEQVVDVLARCQAAGINTVQARGDYHRVLYWMELFRRQGGALHWIAQTASEMHDVFQNIRILAAAGAMGIYHHGTRTDYYWQQGQIDRVQDYLKCMRDSGVQVGLGTHLPEVIEYAEEKGWDVDFYMACMYNLSRKPRESALVLQAQGDAGAQRDPSQVNDEEYLAEDRARMCAVVRQTPKTCLAFKILAASRNCATQADVRAAFEYAFAHIKPQDAVVVGMYPKYVDQVALNVEHTLHAIRSEA